MSKSKKGLKAELSLLQSAKELFYKNGYEKTPIKDICENADVHIGTFTYYYKKKSDLIKAIYADFLMHTYTFVDIHSDGSLNSIQKNAYAILVYYRGLFVDEQTINFHNEVLSKISLYEFINKNLTRIYASFVKDFNLNIDQNELRIVSSADLGVRRELTLEYMSGDFPGDIVDLYRNIYMLMGRLFKMPELLMKQYIEEAIVFSDKYDKGKIKLLI